MREDSSTAVTAAGTSVPDSWGREESASAPHNIVRVLHPRKEAKKRLNQSAPQPTVLAGEDGWGAVAAPGTLSHEQARALKENHSDSDFATDDPPAGETASHSAIASRATGERRMAHLFVEEFGQQLRCVHTSGGGGDWYYWSPSDGRWCEDIDGEHRRMLDQCLDTAQAKARNDPDLQRTINRCDQSSGMDGVIKIASFMRPVTAKAEQLDSHPHLLNTPAGTINLDTCEVQDHNPADMLAKSTRGSWRPDLYGDGNYGNFGKFLEQVLPDPRVRHYLQVWAGVALYGRVLRRVLLIAKGGGANGKSVFYETLLHALGSYGQVATPTLFMTPRNQAGGANADLVALKGVRMVVTSETERDQPLAEAQMKSLTGGDTITARAPHDKKSITFTPSHSPLLVTNELPTVNGDATAVWDRLTIVEFDVTIPEERRDDNLLRRLQERPDEALSWAMDGWVWYVNNGRKMPDCAAVKQATKDYRYESDTIAQFLDECCVIGEAMSAKSSKLMGAYRLFCQRKGLPELNSKRFSQGLAKKFNKRKSSGVMTFFGLGLLQEE